MLSKYSYLLYTVLENPTLVVRQQAERRHKRRLKKLWHTVTYWKIHPAVIILVSMVWSLLADRNRCFLTSSTRSHLDCCESPHEHQHSLQTLHIHLPLFFPFHSFNNCSKVSCNKFKCCLASQSKNVSGCSAITEFTVIEEKYIKRLEAVKPLSRESGNYSAIQFISGNARCLGEE